MSDPDLHGNAPDVHSMALLVVDMINDLEFPGAKAIAPAALRVARKLAPLLERARAIGVPVIYVNDNFGRWQSDFHAQIRHCRRKGCPGAKVTELVAPAPGDYYVLKPKHSGFYASPLGLLLEHIGARQLVFTGMTLESCVYFTASEAYLRDFEVVVVSDCVVGQSIAGRKAALTMLRQTLKAKIATAKSLRLRRK